MNASAQDNIVRSPLCQVKASIYLNVFKTSIKGQPPQRRRR